jgi:hypothetical protein
MIAPLDLTTHGTPRIRLGQHHAARRCVYCEVVYRDAGLDLYCSTACERRDLYAQTTGEALPSAHDIVAAARRARMAKRLGGPVINHGKQ